MNIFLQGLVMGLAYAAPIGMQNLFVIDAALTGPRQRALLTALAVIFFDVTLAAACFFGAGAIFARSQWLQMLVLLVGGLLVSRIGIGLLRANPAAPDQTKPIRSLRKTVVSACVVTWCNPQALLDGTMMLGAFRASLPEAQSLSFLFGVAAASCVWFLGLSSLIASCGHRLEAKHLLRINVVCGAVIVLYGGKLLWHFASLLLL